MHFESSPWNLGPSATIVPLSWPCKNATASLDFASRHALDNIFLPPTVLVFRMWTKAAIHGGEEHGGEPEKNRFGAGLLVLAIGGVVLYYLLSLLDGARQ